MKYAREEVGKAIIEFVDKYIENNSVYPSYREIAKGLGFSAVSSIHTHITRLQAEGKLDVNGKRGVSTAKQKVEVAHIPLVGSISCGSPILAEENVEEYIPILKSELGNGEFFCLRAKGDSMINAGINDGELVFVKKQNTAEIGDIIVALIDDEATLKRYFIDKKHHKIRLHPENSKYEDMYFDEILIQGKAVKILKNI